MGNAPLNLVLVFLKPGKIHCPYMLDGESLPHISGVRGMLKRMDDEVGETTADHLSDDNQMQELHQQQVRTVEYVDGVSGALIGKVPKDAHFINAAEHGECCGESGFFGYGPIVHPKVMAVPLLEGRK